MSISHCSKFHLYVAKWWEQFQTACAVNFIEISCNIVEIYCNVCEIYCTISEIYCILWNLLHKCEIYCTILKFIAYAWNLLHKQMKFIAQLWNLLHKLWISFFRSKICFYNVWNLLQTHVKLIADRLISKPFFI